MVGYGKKGRIRDKARLILDALDQGPAPVNINWNMEDMWLKAIETGLRAVEEAEDAEDAAGK